MKSSNNWACIDLNKVKTNIEGKKKKVLLGIDGIIDEVWQVLETRITKDEYITLDKLKQFGEKIIDRGEGGMANEIIRKRRCSGGFTSNTGRALINLGLDTNMLGMYGEAEIDKVFQEFNGKANLVSIGNPAVCNVLEFSDGKIFLPYLENLLHFNWDKLYQKLGKEKIKDLFSNTNIVALGYWSNMPDFDKIVRNLVENYFTDNFPQRMFFDFANLSKRSKENLINTLSLLADLDCKVASTLSLNKHEAELLFKTYNFNYAKEIDDVLNTLYLVRKKLKIDEIIIHTPYYALAVSKESEGIVKQDYCSNPVKTAGAGDTFNAGYILAYLCNLDIKTRLALANSTTSFYLKNGYPPNKIELINELKRIKNKLT